MWTGNVRNLVIAFGVSPQMNQMIEEMPSVTDEIVLATASLRRYILLALGPFVLIAILAVMLSPKSISDVMSVDNWTQPTFIRPYPLFGLGCLIIYIGLIFAKGIKLLKSRDRLVWIRDGYLVVEGKQELLIADIDPNSIDFDEGLIRRNMNLMTLNGGHHVVRLAFANYDIGFIKQQMRRLSAISHQRTWA
jgi:hypothetical protein